KIPFFFKFKLETKRKIKKSKSPEIKKEGEFFKKFDPTWTKVRNRERGHFVIGQNIGKQKDIKKIGNRRVKNEVRKKPIKKFRG
ncbi:MAG: hypothetical protein ACHQYQ_03550, partial [Bacteriovoracales bacterium]